MSSPPSGSKPEPLLIVLSGPSGVGKDSVLRGLKERVDNLHFVVTVNTREPRPDEQEGVDYHFISHAEFERMLANDELLEHAHVYNDYKGVPRGQVRSAMAAGKDVIMRLDVQGAATIRQVVPEAILIFITTADEEELFARLRSRGTDSPADIEKRIQTAREELARVEEYDYVVVNAEGKLDEAIERIVEIIRSEHQREQPRQVTL